MTPIKLTTTHKRANPTLTCTSCHVYWGDKCDAPCTSKTSSFHSWAAGTWSFGTLQLHNNISVVQLKPTKKYLQRLLVPLAFATAKSAFIRLGPQPTQKCWQERPTDELTPSRKCLLPPAWWRQTTTWLPFDSRMLKLKMKSRCGRAGRRGGARVSTVDCARSPYGESTFKRNRPSFAVLMVLGGGGGGGKLIWPFVW